MLSKIVIKVMVREGRDQQRFGATELIEFSSDLKKTFHFCAVSFLQI